MRPIHLAELDRTRPVLVLTRELVRPHLTRVTVAPITTTIRGLSTEIPVGPANGLDRPSVVSCDNIVTVPAAALGQQIGLLLTTKSATSPQPSKPPSTWTDQAGDRSFATSPAGRSLAACDAVGMVNPVTAEIVLTPVISNSPAELAAYVSTRKRRRLFSDLQSALEWTRGHAEVITVSVESGRWSAGTIPAPDPSTRPVDPETERQLIDEVDEAFRRSAAERKRYAEPVLWYLAFELPEVLELDRAVAALRSCPDVIGLTIREPPQGRPHLFVHVEARSRDNVLRAKHEPISAALRAAAPPIRMPAAPNVMVDLSIIGHHQIGLVEFEHHSRDCCTFR